eukprot:1067634-Rhodomonas_salina.3
MQAAGAGESVRSKLKSSDSTGGAKKKGVVVVADGDGDSIDTVVGDITAISNMCDVLYCMILCREGWQCSWAQINELIFDLALSQTVPVLVNFDRVGPVLEALQTGLKTQVSHSLHKSLKHKAGNCWNCLFTIVIVLFRAPNLVKMPIVCTSRDCSMSISMCMSQVLHDFLRSEKIPMMTPDHALLFKKQFEPWTDKVCFDTSRSKFTSKLTDLDNEEGASAPFRCFLLACNYHCCNPEVHEISEAEFSKKSKKDTPLYS